MYKVLAADDEVWIRRWLEKTIPEVMPDCRVAAVAEDGEAALRALREEEIDIVVSDIRMPMATGLEIALAAGKSEKRPKVILVSGYDEFGYAKQAIDLNVVSYLLKPIDKQELQQALQRAAAEIRQE
ncbi:response regulator, partial [Allofournierella sp.]